MKKHLLIRRFLSTLLLLVVSTLSWAYDFEVDGIWYRNSDATSVSVIIGFSKYSGSVTIPSSVTYNDIVYSVTSIDHHAFYNCSDLISVTIPNSVTYIGEQAFYGCSSLTSVTIPNSVTYIDEQAFSGCSGLTSINIPESVTSIGYNAFSGCTSLPVIDNIRYADTYLIEAVDKTQSTYNIKNKTRFIGNSAFNGCSNLTSVTIPESVTSIGWDAFRDCSQLTSVTIPESVTSIDGRVFYGCSGLTSVTLGNRVTSIGYSAFYGCSSLTKAEFASIESLCKITFGNAESNPLCYAKHLYIDGHEVKDLVIPESVMSIGNYVFSGCSSLTSVTIPNSVTCIGDGAFRGCSSLTSVTIPHTVTSIGDYSFQGCSNLTSITIPKDVTSIGSSAFSGCSGLTSVTIPNSLTYIGTWAFYGCFSLTSVTCWAERVPSMGSDVFYNSPIGHAVLYVPESSLIAYKNAAQWKDFDDILPIDPSDVDELKASEVKKTGTNAPIYDLNGRRLNEKPKRGIYIQGRKKYFVE